jgi:hypothetical protein
VEGFFATLTRRRLQRGVFRSLVDLQAAINRYLGEHNRQPKPFVWTADPDRIIEKVKRGYQAIASDHQQSRLGADAVAVAARPRRSRQDDLAVPRAIGGGRRGGEAVRPVR